MHRSARLKNSCALLEFVRRLELSSWPYLVRPRLVEMNAVGIMARFLRQIPRTQAELGAVGPATVTSSSVRLSGSSRLVAEVGGESQVLPDPGGALSVTLDIPGLPARAAGPSSDRGGQ